MIIDEHQMYSIIQLFNTELLSKISGDFNTASPSVGESISFVSKVDGEISIYTRFSNNVDILKINDIIYNENTTGQKLLINVGDTIDIKTNGYYWTYIILFTE